MRSVRLKNKAIAGPMATQLKSVISKGHTCKDAPETQASPSRKANAHRHLAIIA